jgi:hypothetical protein
MFRALHVLRASGQSKKPQDLVTATVPFLKVYVVVKQYPGGHDNSWPQHFCSAFGIAVEYPQRSHFRALPKTTRDNK